MGLTLKQIENAAPKHKAYKHGESDPQVPPANSALFVKALREHHKAVFYFTYPGELHGFSQPAHRLDAWQKELAFLEHYINPKYGTATTSTGRGCLPRRWKGRQRSA